MIVKAFADFLTFLFAFGIVSAVTPSSNIVVYVPFNVVNSDKQPNYHSTQRG
jgi:hypothetical protein